MINWRGAAPLLLTFSAAMTGCGRIGVDRRDEHGMTALMHAAELGNRAEVARLIAQGARVNATVPTRNLREFIAFISWMQQLPKSDIGYRALHYAAAGGHADVAKLLIDEGAEVDHQARGETNALDLAIFRSDTSTMQVLLAAGARPGGRQLWTTVSLASPQAVRLLLRHGADVKTPPPAMVPATLPPRPPLAITAAMRGDTSILRMLVEAGLDVNERDRNGWTALRHARGGQSRGRRGRADDTQAIVAILEAAGANDTAGARSDALFDAVRKGDSMAVRAALDARANPNMPDERGVPPLLYATRGGNVAIVSALIAAGARVNVSPQNDATPIVSAIEGGHVEVVKVLLAAGARADLADHIRRTPLQVASSWKRVEITALLLEAGAPVDSLALPYAALGGGVEQVKMLLARGADPNAGRGHALSEATRGCYRRDNTDVIRVLLDGGANPQLSGEYSPLHRAVGLCDAEVIHMLLGHGADPNARDMNGVTPLMSAAASGRLDNVRLLIAAHANASARDSSGKSVLEHAARHPEVQQVLRRAGAQ